MPEDVNLSHGADPNNELIVSGIYIRLFIANPGWVVRKPMEFLTDLMESSLQIMKSSSPDLQKLEALTEALVKRERAIASVAK